VLTLQVISVTHNLGARNLQLCVHGVRAYRVLMASSLCWGDGVMALACVFGTDQHRKLWDSLYLIVKRNRTEHAWQFPQGGFKRAESVREVCKAQPPAFWLVCDQQCAL
jgi:hypothetical protein